MLACKACACVLALCCFAPAVTAALPSFPPIFASPLPRCRKISDGEFLNCCREAAKKYPEIKYEEMIIDNAMLQMALNPLRFDVMVMPNLYGDIGSGACRRGILLMRISFWLRHSASSRVLHRSC